VTAGPDAAADGAPGWYGKLPMLGDFASRRLPAPFVATCDAWLAEGVAASRQQLGEQWLESYLTAPLWRFVWAPGVVDDAWWFGVLMPSVDSVGRYFPLLVALSLPAAPVDASALAALDALYVTMGRAALANLQPRASLDEFELALTQTGLGSLAHDAALPEAQRLPGRHRHTTRAALSMSRWASGLQAQALALQLAGHSLWWPQAAAGGEHSLSIGSGLPPPAQFSELLLGRW
jgi:type VI secretion system protein ImpM